MPSVEPARGIEEKLRFKLEQPQHQAAIDREPHPFSECQEVPFGRRVILELARLRLPLINSERLRDGTSDFCED